MGLRYHQVLMHALSRRDSSSFPHACIYLQLDEGSEDMNMDEEEEEEGPEEWPAEVRIVPAEASQREYRPAALEHANVVLSITCQLCSWS